MLKLIPQTPIIIMITEYTESSQLMTKHIYIHTSLAGLHKLDVCPDNAHDDGASCARRENKLGSHRTFSMSKP